MPDRWLNFQPGAYEYLPFSAGPRVCLGSVFAIMEIKLVLALFLQRWRPQLRAAIRVDRGGVMVSQPKRDLPVKAADPHERGPEVHISGNVRACVDLT
jgi:cytochrome P450